MRPPRLRVRTWIMLVAVAAVSLATCDMWSRSGLYLRRAKGHETHLKRLAQIRELGYDPYCSLGHDTYPLTYNKWTVPLHHQWVEYHSQMARKYRRAARYPWLTLPADPARPETIDEDTSN